MTRPAPPRALGALGAAALAAAAALAGCSGDDPVAAPAPTTATATATATPSASASASATPSESPSPSPSPSASRTPSPGPTPSAAESSPTVAEVYRAARTAALSAESGHVRGTRTRDGRTLTLDVEGVANGSNQTVAITTPDGGTPVVLTIGEDHWLSGDEAFWAEQTGDAAAGRAMRGKYVPIRESDATELGAFTLRSILTETFALPELAAFEADTGAAQAGEVSGRAAYVLGSARGPRLWVAADGSAALLRAVGPKSAPADLVFSDWDRAERFSPPPASAVVQEG